MQKRKKEKKRTKERTKKKKEEPEMQNKPLSELYQFQTVKISETEAHLISKEKRNSKAPYGCNRESGN